MRRLVRGPEADLDSDSGGSGSGPSAHPHIPEIRKDPEIIRHETAIVQAVNAALGSMEGGTEGELKDHVLRALQPLKSGRNPLRFGSITVIPNPRGGIRLEILFRKEQDPPTKYHAVTIDRSGFQLIEESN